MSIGNRLAWMPYFEQDTHVRQMELVFLSDVIKDLWDILPNTTNIKPFQNKFTIALTAVSTKQLAIPTNEKIEYIKLVELQQFKI